MTGPYSGGRKRYSMPMSAQSDAGSLTAGVVVARRFADQLFAADPDWPSRGGQVVLQLLATTDQVGFDTAWTDLATADAGQQAA